MSAIPDWMVAGSVQGEPVMRRSSRIRSAVRKAVNALVGVASAAAENECAAQSQGLLQRIDARSKVVGLLGLVVVSTFLHSIPTLAICYGFCIVLAALSGVRFRRMAAVWLVVPLFSAVVMLPATLSIVTPGREVWSIGGSSLVVTDAGLIVAGRFVLRSAVCVTLVALLVVTTPRHTLLRSLRLLGAPKLFVALLGMMDRYLVTLARTAEQIHLAKISRTIAQGRLRDEQGWVAAGLGALFRRSQALGQSIYLAMISRGYTGEVRLLDEPRWRGRDVLFLIMAGAFGALMLTVGGRL